MAFQAHLLLFFLTVPFYPWGIFTRAVPGPRFRRGRDPFQTAGAGAWKAAPALCRGLQFLFYTTENEIFSASKSLKNTKIASKFEPKEKKHKIELKIGDFL